MAIVGYQVGRVYDELQTWWLGGSSLLKVELMLGFKHPFLRQLFYDAKITNIRRFKEEGVS